MGAVAVSPDQHQVAVTSEDRARFEALVNEHLDSLYGSALRLTRNRAAAEDLIQDTFLKAWRSFHTFQLLVAKHCIHRIPGACKTLEASEPIV